MDMRCAFFIYELSFQIIFRLASYFTQFDENESLLHCDTKNLLNFLYVAHIGSLTFSCYIGFVGVRIVFLGKLSQWKEVYYVQNFIRRGLSGSLRYGGDRNA